MKKLLFIPLLLITGNLFAEANITISPRSLWKTTGTWTASQTFHSSVTFSTIKVDSCDGCGGGSGGGGGGGAAYFNGSQSVGITTFTIPGFPVSFNNGFATITVIAASPTWTGSHTFRSSTTFIGPVSSLTVSGNFVAIGSMTARGVITSTAGFIGGRSTFSSIAVGVDDLSFGGIFNALDPTTGISFNGNVVSMYTQGGNAGTYGTEHLAIPKLQFTTSGGGQSEPVLKLSSLDSTHGLFSNYTGLTLNHWGLSHNGNEVIRVQNDTGKIAFGRIKPIADVTISTGYLSGPGPILGVYNGSPRFEVNRSSVVVYSSMTVRDIIISTTGALLGGATIQGRFAVEGGSLVLNNSLLVFGPVAPSNGQVPKYNGTNGLIEWSADNTGAGGNGPITAAEWNAHTSTDSHIEILRLQQSTDTLVYNGGITITALAQGSNVTLSQSGSTLTIASSGGGGGGPITTAEWNAHTSTDSRIADLVTSTSNIESTLATRTLVAYRENGSPQVGGDVTSLNSISFDLLSQAGSTLTIKGLSFRDFNIFNATNSATNDTQNSTVTRMERHLGFHASTTPYLSFSIPAGSFVGMGDSSGSWANQGFAISSAGPMGQIPFNRMRRSFHEMRHDTYSFVYADFQMPWDWDGSSVGVRFWAWASSGTANTNFVMAFGAIGTSSGTTAYPTVTDVSSTSVVMTYVAADQMIYSRIGSLSIPNALPGQILTCFVTRLGDNGRDTHIGLTRFGGVTIFYRRKGFEPGADFGISGRGAESEGE